MSPNRPTGLTVKLGSLTGCVLLIDSPCETFASVGEARAAILAFAFDRLDTDQLDTDNREHLRLRFRDSAPTWDDLAACEAERTYDPADPGGDMTCSYLLYQQGGLDGVGGMIWTFAVQIWVTAPPEVWDHPADQPAGLDVIDGHNSQWISDLQSNRTDRTQ